MENSILGFLASRFSNSQENLATEALNYVLGQSILLRNELVEFINQIGCNIKGPLNFQTQVFDDDNSIPDLVGINEAGTQALIIEAKFWAGLTENQPATYLKRLNDEENSVLLFVAPAKRFQTLWPELKRRCAEVNSPVYDEKMIGDEIISSKLNGKHHLALCSWRVILQHLNIKANVHGLTALASDIQQIEGLCNKMDTAAFLPIKSEELSSGHAIRYIHFHQLIDEVAASLIANRVVSTQGLRATPAYCKYIRYLKTGQFGLALQFNSNYWSEFSETPFWLSIQKIPSIPSKWTFSKEAKDALQLLELSDPPRLFHTGTELIIPLFIPLGLEKTDVINSIYNQVVEIIDLLKEGQSMNIND